MKLLVVCVPLLIFTQLVSGKDLESSGEEESSYLEPVWWNFIIDCDSQVNSLQCDSLTLNQIANNVTETPRLNVTIEITTSQLQLNGTVEFRGHESLTITGDSTVITCTERDSGLVFTDINKVTIRGVTLTNCGTHDEGSIYYQTVSLRHCRDITVTNVYIVKNLATGLSIVDHQGGTVRISSSHFTENTISAEDEVTYGKQLRGGGGIFIGNYEIDPSSPTTYYFENCLFKRNLPHTRSYFFEYTDELGQAISGFGRGGGVFLGFEIPLTDVHTVFSECQFIENGGFFGGGLSVDIEGGKQDKKTKNVTVTVKDSLFEANGCSSETPTGSGGGAHLNFNTFTKQQLSFSQFRFINVNFTSNCAELGGGVYFFSDHRDTNTELNTLIFDRCNFSRNRAHTGTAIDLTPNLFDRLANGFLLVPTIKDCHFLSNINVRSINTETTFGTGTIYSSQYSITFTGECRFFNNSGTALYMVNGLADFSNGSVTFERNYGNRGGGMALIGLSSFLVGTEGSYSFVNNTAMDRGGAIYTLLIDNHDYTVSRSCFIQYVDSNNTDRVVPLSEWEANITFVGNRAKSGTGHAIFVTSLYPCQVVNNGSTDEYMINTVVNISDALSVRGITFDNDPFLQPQTSTEGAVLEPRNNEIPLYIIPGEQYSHGVTLSDDLHNPVDATFQASLNDNSKVNIDSAFSSCLSDQITLKGEPKQSAFLILQTVSPRQTYIRLEVSLAVCPPGFALNQDKCICNAHLYSGFLRCDINTLQSYLNPGYWTGLVGDGEDSNGSNLAIGICPPLFCDYNETEVNVESGIRLPRNVALLDRAICGISRTGILCGGCNSGYTTHFHSPSFKCKEVDPVLCKIGWLFYIISELVPVTVVFITVLVLNISFTSGAVNGFILFSQLINTLNIDAGGFINLSGSTLFFIRSYRVIYGFFNLDYFNVETLSFCLWTNASALDMIAFKYVTIIYALFLIFIVVWFMNKCGGRCLGKWCRITKLNSSVIHGITTFLVMCYAQCIYVSLTLLLRYRYTSPGGSPLRSLDVVWLNGNLDYFSRRHLPYALPALFCMLTIGILPLILLLVYPLVYKVLAIFNFEDSKPVAFVFRKLSFISLKPLFDSFQGCFKDNLRFFAGLYFMYRWIGLIINASTSSYSKFFTTVEVLLLCVLALHAICQPYINSMHNTIDTLLFTNLAVINAISFANYYIMKKYGDKGIYRQKRSAGIAIQLVLIYIPAAILLVSVFVKFYRLKWHNRKQESSTEESTTQKFSNKVQRFRSLVSVDSVENEEELPHRLVASGSEYRSYGERNFTLSSARETSLTSTY